MVEVLIVAAVIGILAMILLPLFATVRDSSRTVACAANLRQIGLGIAMYAQDNNGFYPKSAKPFSGSVGDCAWPDYLQPYVKSPQVFWCPQTDKGEYRPGCPPVEYIEGDGPVKELKYDGSYAPVVVAVPAYKRIRDTQFKRPSGTVVVIDGETEFINLNAEPSINPDTLRLRGVSARHRSGANALFADGHVKWLSLQAMTEPSLWSASGLP